MDNCLKLVYEISSEDCVLWVVHFNNVEGDVFCPWVGQVLEGYWECYLSKRIDPFASEANEWDVRWLQEVAVYVHAVEGAREDDVCGASSVDHDFSDGPALNIGANDQCICMWEAEEVHVFFREGYWHV